MSPLSEIMPNSAAVPATRVVLQILDGLRGRFLGRTDQGNGPHVREKRIQRIEAVRRMPST